MDGDKKRNRYERIIAQLKPLFEKVDNPVARMSTMVALLHHKIDYFFWTGFYLLDENGELIVGPYQGSLACMKLKKHAGVCWAAIDGKKTMIVKDVYEFPGHIACDSRSKSEIVIPLKNRDNTIVGVLDVDSSEISSFDETDGEMLEELSCMIF